MSVPSWLTSEFPARGSRLSICYDCCIILMLSAMDKSYVGALKTEISSPRAVLGIEILFSAGLITVSSAVMRTSDAVYGMLRSAKLYSFNF